MGKRIPKRTPRKTLKSKSSKKAGYSKDSMDMAKPTDEMNQSTNNQYSEDPMDMANSTDEMSQPTSSTKTKVREQRKDMNVEHGIKRANMKKHADTHKKASVRQNRKQHVRTKRRTKGKHEEEREMVEEM